MSGRTTLSLAIIALSLTVVIPADHAVAQQKQQVSFKATPENTKYTQQHVMDVGDVPNHVVRMFEANRNYSSNSPVINGIKLTESWERGLSDLIEGNGTTNAYVVYVMENGDKFFARATSVIENNSGRLTATQVGRIIGGTGKLAGIEGKMRTVATFEIKSGFNESQTEIEYTFPK